MHNEMESLTADCQKSAGCIPDFKARFPAGLEKELFSAFCSREFFVSLPQGKEKHPQGHWPLRVLSILGSIARFYLPVSLTKDVETRILKLQRVLPNKRLAPYRT